jgi:hypothetical protein
MRLYKREREIMKDEDKKFWLYEGLLRAEEVRAYYKKLYDNPLSKVPYKEIKAELSHLERIIEHYHILMKGKG